MDVLSSEDCQRIAEKSLNVNHVEVVSYEIRCSTDAAAGFIGAAKILQIVAKSAGQVVVLNLFTKALPENSYHRKNVEISQVFYKEAEFFRLISPGISKYFTDKVIPKCFHADPEKLLVFENLALQGYKNVDPTSLFDLEHCRAVLARLASFHSASFLYEKSMKATIDEMFPHIGCDQITWYKNEKGHPGYEHCQTGVRALGEVLDRHFSHVSSQVRDKVRRLLASNPLMLLPSKKYRNALSHSDLWCNNVMYKYDDQNRIEDCILVDFQLFGYCPPSFDVYAIVHITTDKTFRQQHLKEMIEFYYNTFSTCIRHHGENPNDFLTWQEFNDSVSEAVPLALTNHAIFMHYCLLPEDELEAVFNDLEKTKQFMERDRSDVVLRSIEKNDMYRSRVFAALSDCIDYVTGNLKH